VAPHEAKVPSADRACCEGPLRSNPACRDGDLDGAAALTGLVVLLAWIPLRQRLGIGTVANVAVIAVSVDLALAALPAPDGLAARASLMVGGVMLNGLTTAALRRRAVGNRAAGRPDDRAADPGVPAVGGDPGRRRVGPMQATRAQVIRTCR
jgi:hypothetical protein